ncbi:hypothetical protein IFM89_025077 [Coptis chinensis]|uniref:peroxidase n=1 Tax=Coptis chinensis TaxID=261450 RepID=A0A835HZT2_9MAGN|nr:hypothetical protein IFM89_025077 [Coptis chinensis]
MNSCGKKTWVKVQVIDLGAIPRIISLEERGYVFPVWVEIDIEIDALEEEEILEWPACVAEDIAIQGSNSSPVDQVHSESCPQNCVASCADVTTELSRPPGFGDVVEEIQNSNFESSNQVNQEPANNEVEVYNTACEGSASHAPVQEVVRTPSLEAQNTYSGVFQDRAVSSGINIEAQKKIRKVYDRHRKKRLGRSQSHSLFLMGSFPLLVLLISLSSLHANAKLTTDYYVKSCPQFEKIIQDTVYNKQSATPTAAAATLRVFLHDCMINGCDASVLVSSNSFNKAERDHEMNLNLPGDAFDVITRAKAALELACPGIVSCSDILSQATRDFIKMVGGPFYKVRLGRKDSLVSRYSDVEGKLPMPSMSMDQILAIFKSKGISEQELVALIGGHTIGFSHCKEFANRIYNYSNTSDIDPTLNPEFAKGLKQLCTNYHTNPSMAAFNDVVTPGKFDNMYYQNLKRGLGLLTTDQIMLADPRTRPFAERYAANQTEFFNAFALAIEKVSRLEVKVGNQGEVRHKCDAFNNINTSNKH